MSVRHVAVIGGGFAGTLQAVQLLRHGIERVTLIERARTPGRGAAYSTSHPDHLLNVRASSMSAFADAPAHFADWHSDRGGEPSGFAERRQYGAYVEEILAAAREEAGSRLDLVQGDVVALEQRGGSEVVVLDDGAEMAVDAAVLAIGNLPPDAPPWLGSAGLAPGVFVDDPWAFDFAAGLWPEDTVLLIGTGLTMVDAALVLDAAGFRGRTLALSRRGLLPRAHSDPVPVPPLGEEPDATCVGLLRFVRRSASRMAWREAVDQLRPVTQQLWSRASVAERQRFLRHLRPWWDVHRHRIAPSIADRIRSMEEAGCLEVSAGKIRSVRSDPGGAIVTWRDRGGREDRSLKVARIVNCTGPQRDIRRAGEPLLDRLLAAERIRPDPCGIGIDVDKDSRVLAPDGAASARLSAVGPMTRGTFWEIVAVPDIRVQVEGVARRLASA